MAAAFRSIGIEATVTPDSTDETLSLGGQYSSGEECLPLKITLGDFLRICHRPDFDPRRTAFFMPSASGPCRFGQYAEALKQVLRELGHADVPVFSPSSADGYEGIGEMASQVMRLGWMGIVLGDLAVRFVLKTRPYERTAGDSDEVYAEAIEDFQQILERQGVAPHDTRGVLVNAVTRMRNRFRGIPARYTKDRLFVGVVGEIFCRQNVFSNDDLIRRLEQKGGECWLSDIAEWVWYTNWRQERDIVRQEGTFNLSRLKHRIKTHVQHRDEQILLSPVVDDLRGYEEPENVLEVLDAAEPYLPPTGALGEMVLSIGKAVYLYGKGVDGVVDVSPFTCMNGVVCEAVYPAVSSDCDNLPIRSCYFDGVDTHLDRDQEIFLDLARAYRSRKRPRRVYPDYFE